MGCERRNSLKKVRRQTLGGLEEEWTTIPKA